MQELQRKQKEAQILNDLLNDKEGAHKRTIEGRIEHVTDLQYAQHKNIFAVSYSSIHKAASDGNASGVHYFLGLKTKPRVRVDDYDKFGICALHYAAEKGHDSLCQLLIDKGTPVDIPTTDGMTAFMYACKNNRLSTMDLLFENSASILSTNRAGMTAAHFAAQLDHLPVFEKLLGMNLLAKERCLSEIAEAEMAAENPDELAAEKAKKELVKQKLERQMEKKGGDEDDDHEDDSSTVAYDDGDEESTISGAPVDKGAGGKVKAPGGDGGADELNSDPVEALRQKYAPLLCMEDTAIVDLPSRNGTRPSHIAATYDSLGVLELLIRVKCEINAQDSAGENTLHKAARRCNTDAYKMIVKAGGYENVKNTSRETAAGLLKDNSMV